MSLFSSCFIYRINLVSVLKLLNTGCVRYALVRFNGVCNSCSIRVGFELLFYQLLIKRKKEESKVKVKFVKGEGEVKVTGKGIQVTKNLIMNCELGTNKILILIIVVVVVANVKRTFRTYYTRYIASSSHRCTQRHFVYLSEIAILYNDDDTSMQHRFNIDFNPIR